MPKYTQGPWAKDSSFYENGAIWPIIDSTGDTPAHVFDEQDAKLVASAPEMLKALEAQQRVALHTEACLKCTESRRCPEQIRLQTLANEARWPALSKAKGE